VGTSPQNGTSTISTLYSTVKDHTELAFAVVKRNKQIHQPCELYLGCCRDTDNSLMFFSAKYLCRSACVSRSLLVSLIVAVREKPVDHACNFHDRPVRPQGANSFLIF
jgi:hypothetical protein